MVNLQVEEEVLPGIGGSGGWGRGASQLDDGRVRGYWSRSS